MSEHCVTTREHTLLNFVLQSFHDLHLGMVLYCVGLGQTAKRVCSTVVRLLKAIFRFKFHKNH